MDLCDRARKEVEELHQFFERWFTAACANTPAELRRVQAVWSAPFELVDPHGVAHSADRLLEDFTSQYGAFPDLRIRIAGLMISRSSGASILARYEERHEDGDEIDVRICEAEFAVDRLAPNGVRWVRLQERSAAALAIQARATAQVAGDIHSKPGGGEVGDR